MGDDLPYVDLGACNATAVSIAAGDFHTCVILSDYTLKVLSVTWLIYSKLWYHASSSLSLVYILDRIDSHILCSNVEKGNMY